METHRKTEYGLIIAMLLGKDLMQINKLWDIFDFQWYKNMGF